MSRSVSRVRNSQGRCKIDFGLMLSCPRPAALLCVLETLSTASSEGLGIGSPQPSWSAGCFAAARRPSNHKSRHVQAVNAAAVDSARCWRRWAKGVCQESAGAAHGFSKVGLDVGDGEGLAGPQLLANQMGTWLLLWLDPRRANAKQLADQENMGESLPRPSLEEVDNVCKTYKHTAGLGQDCINPKAILQLPVELRLRFIDLLAELIKSLSWSHMMVLRPKPSGGHRTIGLTVALLRVLSRLRRPLAQKWENEHDAPHFWGFQGKACDRGRLGTLHHGGGSIGAAAVGSYSIWQSSTSTSGTTTSGKKAAKPVFPRDCWLVGAPLTKAGGFSRPTSAPPISLGLWDHTSRLQWGHNGGKTCAGNPFGNSANAPPDQQALERGRRQFGSRGGNSQDGASPHCRSGQASGGRPPGARFTALQEQIQSLHRRHGQAQAVLIKTVGGAGDRRVRHAGQKQTGTCRQGAFGEGSEAHETCQTASAGRSTLSRSHSQWLECFRALGFGGFGLHPNIAHSNESRHRQSHIPAQPRAKRSQNDAGPCSGHGGKVHRSCFSTSQTSCASLGET